MLRYVRLKSAKLPGQIWKEHKVWKRTRRPPHVGIPIEILDLEYGSIEGHDLAFGDSERHLVVPTLDADAVSPVQLEIHKRDTNNRLVFIQARARVDKAWSEKRHSIHDRFVLRQRRVIVRSTPIDRRAQ